MFQTGTRRTRPRTPSSWAGGKTHHVQTRQGHVTGPYLLPLLYPDLAETGDNYHNILDPAHRLCYCELFWFCSTCYWSQPARPAWLSLNFVKTFQILESKSWNFLPSNKQSGGLASVTRATKSKQFTITEAVCVTVVCVQKKWKIKVWVGILI